MENFSGGGNFSKVESRVRISLDKLAGYTVKEMVDRCEAVWFTSQWEPFFEGIN